MNPLQEDSCFPGRPCAAVFFGSSLLPRGNLCHTLLRNEALRGNSQLLNLNARWHVLTAALRGVSRGYLISWAQWICACICDLCVLTSRTSVLLYYRSSSILILYLVSNISLSFLGSAHSTLLYFFSGSISVKELVHYDLSFFSLFHILYSDMDCTIHSCVCLSPSFVAFSPPRPLPTSPSPVPFANLFLHSFSPYPLRPPSHVPSLHVYPPSKPFHILTPSLLLSTFPSFPTFFAFLPFSIFSHASRIPHLPLSIGCPPSATQTNLSLISPLLTILSSLFPIPPSISAANPLSSHSLLLPTPTPPLPHPNPSSSLPSFLQTPPIFPFFPCARTNASTAISLTPHSPSLSSLSIPLLPLSSLPSPFTSPILQTLRPLPPSLLPTNSPHTKALPSHPHIPRTISSSSLPIHPSLCHPVPSTPTPPPSPPPPLPAPRPSPPPLLPSLSASLSSPPPLSPPPSSLSLPLPPSLLPSASSPPLSLPPPLSPPSRKIPEPRTHGPSTHKHGLLNNFTNLVAKASQTIGTDPAKPQHSHRLTEGLPTTVHAIAAPTNARSSSRPCEGWPHPDPPKPPAQRSSGGRWKEPTSQGKRDEKC
ncbi:hypothetical protein C7M84_019979 [Penaeus vannamei]|uniref:Uncharacterized protein n=1 Tax=Penaeus vannamei TaxID=6689 RepID=A0A423SDB4_PENVA|nr:hypothetical protein C7M84_019979 [Penaeus vannamei]